MSRDGRKGLDPGDIADFLEGNLTPDERAEFLTALDDDNEARARFADVLESVHALGEPVDSDFPEAVTTAAGSAEVSLGVTHSRLRHPYRWLAAAALFLLGVALTVTWVMQTRAPTFKVADFLAPMLIESTPAVGASLADRRVIERGEQGVTAFRLGVELVDLRVSLMANDRQQRERVLRRIERLLESTGSSSSYATVLTSLDREPPSGFEIFENDLEEDFDSTLLAFGKWAESGRVAAVERNAEVFANEPFHGFVDVALQLNLDSYVRSRIERVAELIESPVEREDLEEIEELLSSVVNLNGGL